MVNSWYVMLWKHLVGKGKGDILPRVCKGKECYGRYLLHQMTFQCQKKKRYVTPQNKAKSISSDEVPILRL